MNISPSSAFDTGLALRRRLPSPANDDGSSSYFPTVLNHKVETYAKGEHQRGIESTRSSERNERGSTLEVEEARNEDVSPNALKDVDKASSILRANSTDEQIEHTPGKRMDVCESDSSQSGSDESDDQSKQEDDENGEDLESEGGVRSGDSGETEDEEVKMNCVGKVVGGFESDDNETVDGDENDGSPFTDNNDQPPWSRQRVNDESDAASETSRERNEVLVTFVSGKTAAAVFGSNVQRPTPITGSASAVEESSPADCGSDSNDGDVSDDSSVMSNASSSTASNEGGRGLGLALDDNNTPYNSENDSDASSEAESDSESSSSSDEESLSAKESDKLNEEESDFDDDEAEDDKSVDGQDDDEDTGFKSDQDMKLSTEYAQPKPMSSSMELELEQALDANEASVGESSSHTNSMVNAESKKKKDLGLGHIRSESISMEELEEIINESSSKDGDNSDSDLEFSDTEEKEDEPVEQRHPVDSSDDEVAGLLSETLEFDYWSFETVSAAVAVLSGVSKDSSQGIRYPINLPSCEDASFWIDKMLASISAQSRALQHLSDHPDRRLSASKIVYNAFHKELASLDLTSVLSLGSDVGWGDQVSNQEQVKKRNLFVGSFASAESRLALAALSIKHVILISSHPLDELWVGDGVTYSTHLLPSFVDGRTTPVYEAISSATQEVAAALEESSSLEGKSVLVACSTGDQHSCAVGALYSAQNLKIEKSSAIKRMTELRPSAKIDAAWLEEEVQGKDITVKPSPRNKRVLSSQMLSDLLREPGTSESPKRLCFSRPEKNDTRVALPPLPLFNLGAAAEREGTSSRILLMRQPEQGASSTDEDEELEYERCLSEELDGKSVPEKEDHPPVPLLTPPSSPLVVHGDEGATTVCEWPSNLTVDSAMTSAIELRPLSPNSLQRQEEEQENRLKSKVPRKPKKIMEKAPPPETGLTPKMSGIRVSFRSKKVHSSSAGT